MMVASDTASRDGAESLELLRLNPNEHLNPVLCMHCTSLPQLRNTRFVSHRFAVLFNDIVLYLNELVTGKQ
jgi:hypothetical protein